MIFQAREANVAESEVEDGAETKIDEELENNEEQMNLERSGALAIFDKHVNQMILQTSKVRDTRMVVPLGQYATINTDVRYNPLAKDAYKFEIGVKPLTKAVPADNDGAKITTRNMTMRGR